MSPAAKLKDVFTEASAFIFTFNLNLFLASMNTESECRQNPVRNLSTHCIREPPDIHSAVTTCKMSKQLNRTADVAEL